MYIIVENPQNFKWANLQRWCKLTVSWIKREFSLENGLELLPHSSYPVFLFPSNIADLFSDGQDFLYRQSTNLHPHSLLVRC